MAILTNERHQNTRSRHISAILMSLLLEKESYRAKLADQLRVSNATITNLVNELFAQNILTEAGQIRHGVGRPQTALQINPKARYAIGIHLDVDKVYVALTDLLAKRVDDIVLAQMRDLPWEVVIDAAVQAAKKLYARQNIPETSLIGVGVAASGLVAAQEGVNVTSPNMGWHNVPLKSHIEERLQLPTVVENNVRTMALYEALFGVAQQAHTMAFVYTRIGIGAGLIIDHQLYRGASAGAGEIGHMPIIYDNGDTCRCGNRGCLETVFSEPVIMRQAHQIAAQHPGGLLAKKFSEPASQTLATAFEAASEGDTPTLHMLKDRARYFGIALANLVNVFDPQMIILGGIFAHERGTLLPVIHETVCRHTFGACPPQTHIQVTERGNTIGVEGAAALALDRLFYRPTLETL